MPRTGEEVSEQERRLVGRRGLVWSNSRSVGRRRSKGVEEEEVCGQREWRSVGRK